MAKENTPPRDLEIKDAKVIFHNVWDDLEDEFGHENLRFPKELILLGGAPGAGKGTQTNFIMRERGFSGNPIVISQLLTTPEMQKVKNNGQMVGDREVMSILFRKLILPEFRDGALLDGFPRTKVQVECLKLLVEKINSLHTEFKGTPMAMHFRRPVIHVMVLFVEEKESVERQLNRGREIKRHNDEVERSGIGEKLELRPTDLVIDAARGRYQVFRDQTWNALQSLQEIYHYHFVNAQGTVEEVERNILRELQYQSSLELDQQTYDYIRVIPLASEITVNARTDLVKRLDTYALNHSELFKRVIQIINERFMPIVHRHAIGGYAVVNSEDAIFEDSLALAMLIDIFSERGYNACVDKTNQEVVTKFDVNTGEIHRRRKNVYRIRIQFHGCLIRRG